MFYKTLARTVTMSLSSKIPLIEIDPTGVFKYILINLTIIVKDGGDSTNEVVRGYSDCKFHTDIENKFIQQLQNLKKNDEIQDFKTKVLGGGKIDHNPDLKTIKVYSYSQGFGKADHEVTVRLLKTFYKDYNITCSDE